MISKIKNFDKYSPDQAIKQHKNMDLESGSNVVYRVKQNKKVKDIHLVCIPGIIDSA